MNHAEATATTTAAALIIGKMAKEWPSFPDRLIPHLVAISGAIIFPLLAGLDGGRNVILGLAAGWSSTGLNQAYRQIKKEE